MTELVQSALTKVLNLFQRQEELTLEEYNREIIANAPYIREVARRMANVQLAARHRESLRRRPLGMDNELRNALKVIQTWETERYGPSNDPRRSTPSHELLDVTGLADIA